MYRLIATDMDETLLNSQHKLGNVNLAAWKRLRELGCLIVPASGRPYPSILSSFGELAHKLLDDSYVISYNGGTINRAFEAAPLMSHHLDTEIAHALFEWGKTHTNAGMHIYETDGTTWAYRLDENEKAYLAGHLQTKSLPDDTLDALEGANIAKLLFCFSNGMDSARQTLAEMPEELIGPIDTTFSSGRYLEFNPRDINKGTGLEKLCERLNIPIEQTIALGDAENDLEMVETAGVGVAVANASDILKQNASYVAKATNDDGILKEVLERLVIPSLDE